MSASQALVVDDNSKNVTILARMLSKEGFNSIQVTNPKILDSVLEPQHDIRVIFLDLEMPGIDGFQILKKIKSISSFDDVPVIAYTVHVSEIQVALDKGFDGFIGKPLDSDKFPDQLERILNGEGVWETP